jgi:hypothetical protein
MRVARVVSKNVFVPKFARPIQPFFVPILARPCFSGFKPEIDVERSTPIRLRTHILTLSNESSDMRSCDVYPGLFK